MARRLARIRSASDDNDDDEDPAAEIRLSKEPASPWSVADEAVPPVFLGGSPVTAPTLLSPPSPPKLGDVIRPPATAADPSAMAQVSRAHSSLGLWSFPQTSPRR